MTRIEKAENPVEPSISHELNLGRASGARRLTHMQPNRLTSPRNEDKYKEAFGKKDSSQGELHFRAQRNTEMTDLNRM